MSKAPLGIISTLYKFMAAAQEGIGGKSFISLPTNKAFGYRFGEKIKNLVSASSRSAHQQLIRAKII